MLAYFPVNEGDTVEHGNITIKLVSVGSTKNVTIREFAINHLATQVSSQTLSQSMMCFAGPNDGAHRAAVPYDVMAPRWNPALGAVGRESAYYLVFIAFRGVIDVAQLVSDSTYTNSVE